jgi:hypothetical protein
MELYDAHLQDTIADVFEKVEVDQNGMLLVSGLQQYIEDVYELEWNNKSATSSTLSEPRGPTMKSRLSSRAIFLLID